MKLSTLDISALHKLEKYGELKKDGDFFGTQAAVWMLEAKRVESLAARGFCRIDKVGESTFAVFVKGPDK